MERKQYRRYYDIMYFWLVINVLFVVAASEDNIYEKNKNTISSFTEYHDFRQKVSFLDIPTKKADHRKLDANDREWEPLMIKWEMLPTETTNNALVELVTNDILPLLQKSMKDILRVVKVDGKSEIPKDSCGGLDIGTDSSSIDFDQENLVIFVKIDDKNSKNNIVNCEEGVIAMATPCLLHPETFRPASGYIHICEFDDNENLLGSIYHELIHVLGFSSTLFPHFTDSRTGKLLTSQSATTSKRNIPCAGPLSSNRFYQDFLSPIPTTILKPVLSHDDQWVSYELTLPTVSQIIKNHFNCSSDTIGGHLENQPTAPSDCFGSHWDERFHHTTLMSAIFDTPVSHRKLHQTSTKFITPLTLALLEDTGWYRADYTYSTLSTFGLNAGCSFLSKPCLSEEGDVPSYSRGYFCNTPFSRNDDEPILECNPAGTGTGRCDVQTNANPPISYFPSNRDWGPAYRQADYCPLVFSFGDRKSVLCPSERFCLTITNQNSPTCTRMTCQPSKKIISVEYQNNIFSCEYDFQIIPIPSSANNASITCPRLSTICPE